jgi:hypothetical protein
MHDLGDLPGSTLVERGLEDVRLGRTSIESLLVATAATRLAALGLPVGPNGKVADAELRLYALLGERGTPDPYSRYNALKRELASFVHALEHRIERQRRGA